MSRREAVEIHGYVGCPFAWRVRLGAAEKGIAADWIPCDVDDPDPRARAHNPDEHSPLLFLAGFSLLESEIILQFLDERFDGPALMPAEARARAELRLLAVQLRALDVHTEPSRPAARRRSEPALRRLEEALEGRAFLHGAAPGHVDLMIAPFLTNLVVRDLLDRGRFPQVQTYFARTASRPSFQATRPPWAQAL